MNSSSNPTLDDGTADQAGLNDGRPKHLWRHKMRTVGDLRWFNGSLLLLCNKRCIEHGCPPSVPTPEKEMGMGRKTDDRSTTPEGGPRLSRWDDNFGQNLPRCWPKSPQIARGFKMNNTYTSNYPCLLALAIHCKYMYWRTAVLHNRCLSPNCYIVRDCHFWHCLHFVVLLEDKPVQN